MKNLILWPVIVFCMSSMLFIWIFSKYRKTYMRFSDSEAVRGLATGLVAVVFPLGLGAWADVVDISKALGGDLTWSDAIWLAVMGSLLPPYLCLHGFIYSSETERQREMTDFELERAELICQRDFLLRFMSNIESTVADVQNQLPPKSAEVLPELKTLLDPNSMAAKYAQAAYSAFRRMIPDENSLRVALLVERSGFLEPVYSYNGKNTEWLDGNKTDNRAAFSLSEPNNSLATSSVLANLIWIVDDATTAAADLAHPFKFFGNEARQRDKIRSLMAVPLCTKQRRVLVFDTDKIFGFQNSYTWKAKRIMDSISHRISFMEKLQETL